MLHRSENGLKELCYKYRQKADMLKIVNKKHEVDKLCASL